MRVNIPFIPRASVHPVLDLAPALWLNGRCIAERGCNGEGRFQTEKEASKAAIELARDCGYLLTVHRS